MRTLPREPWRGGQICGEQLEYGVVPGRSVYCGEFKKLGSPLCEAHDSLERMDGYGSLPKFAPGNATGLKWAAIPGYGWGVYDVHGEVVGSSSSRSTLEEYYSFTLKWEPDEGPVPVIPTPEELAAFQAQLKEASA